MEENPYKAPVCENAKADDDVPRWAVVTMICLGILVTAPGVLLVLAMIGSWLLSHVN
ncbi:MAG TPA: hypothetical protein VG125_11530 [Pirellulales bacterium]|jgi:hypothetical protein|nr:hypothetical protein [Pirellulales bacterium]